MARRVDVGKIRRDEIVEAASAIIAEKGIQHLSLSAIEDRAGLSRGQLTYYFPTKEEILLAVFDRLLQMMHDRTAPRPRGEEAPPCLPDATGWERMRMFLAWFLLRPPDARVFHALQYTFLSQIGHREDFRQALAGLYEEWRSHVAGDFTGEMPDRPGGPAVSPRTFASFFQAILHGLAMQRAADPNAFDREEMLTLCLDILGSYLGRDTTPPSPPASDPNR
jgi:AcrR family transcriptional regulator